MKQTKTLQELFEDYRYVSITALSGTPDDIMSFTPEADEDIALALQSHMQFYYGYIAGYNTLVISPTQDLIDAYFDCDSYRCDYNCECDCGTDQCPCCK